MANPINSETAESQPKTTSEKTAAPEKDLAGTVADAAIDLIPGVKSYKCIQNKDYVGAFVWGAVDTAMCASWILPPLGAGVTTAVAGAKVASTAGKGVEIGAKTLPLLEKLGLGKAIEPVTKAAAPIVGTIGEKIGASTAIKGASKTYAGINASIGTLINKAGVSLAGSGEGLTQVAKGGMEKATQVSGTINNLNPVKKATQFAAEKAKGLDPVANVMEKFSPYEGTIRTATDTVNKLRRGNLANNVGGMVADRLNIPDPIRDITRTLYRGIKGMAPPVKQDKVKTKQPQPSVQTKKYQTDALIKSHPTPFS